MQIVREAYLTEEQMESLGIKKGSDEDMKIQKEQAGKAAEQLCGTRYFPLYEENAMDNPAAYYFTDEKVIVPAGLNELNKKIHVEWQSWNLKEGFERNRIGMKYCPASSEQVAQLRFYLDKIMKSDGKVTEPALSFAASFDYLVTRREADWVKYRILCNHSAKPKGYLLPVWGYSLTGGEDGLNRWAELYQGYGLVPDAGEIIGWLHDFASPKTAVLDDTQYKNLKKKYLEADSSRLENPYYKLTENIFNNGKCWEIFENGQPDTSKICCSFPEGEWLSAIAPSENIVSGGFVSIDFGTKSTVIVIGDQAINSFHTLKDKRGRKDENTLYPTVLKFCNLEKFLKAYKSKAGRPETLWQTVSIDDSAHVGSNVSSGIFRGLKQWMTDPNEKGAVLRQTEKGAGPVILNEYGSEKNSVDPIEIYAYYLGLYINNNRDNKIFLRYRLSFSATWPEQTRKRMRESFERGLKKSLPVSIINSSNMENFSVECTCSEPAAYAVCTLACMGIPSQYRQRFVYGIFDFGGGTCDFNYGIWGTEENKALRKHKYKIWMLGDGGDPFLGGENLLELLAVHVLAEQREWFKQRNYKISRPRCYEGRNEEFFSDSFEAANNLERLADQFRGPLWEKPDNSGEDFEIVTAGLMSERTADNSSDSENHGSATGADAYSNSKCDGATKETDVYSETAPPRIAYEALRTVLTKRIYDGVSAFFNTFYRILEEQGQKDVPQLCVFLAGNSCRSELVRMTFEEYVEKELNRSRISKVYLCDPMGSPGFEECMPSDLWGEEQKERMRANISRLGDLDGKTGVAYGLALYRNKDQIEIEDCSVKDRLLYYLGTFDFFDTQVLRGEKGDRLIIGESVPFASSCICNLYYTEMIPRNGALRGVKTIMLNDQNLPVKENMACFVRANSQTEISIFTAPDNHPEDHASEDELTIDLRTGRFKSVTDTKAKG